MSLAQSRGVFLSCGGATCFALGLEFLEEEGHSHGGHAGHSETPCQTVDTGRGSPSLRLWRAPQSHGTLSLLFEFHGGCFGAECGDFPPRADWWHHGTFRPDRGSRERGALSRFPEQTAEARRRCAESHS